MREAGATWAFDAIGTPWQIETRHPLSDVTRRAVTDLIAAFDQDWSRFRDDSLVSELARRGGAVDAPADAAALLDAYAALSDATDGAVNPLVGASLSSLGYDAAHTLVDHGAIPAPADWRGILEWDHGTVRLAQPASIDVGALGKGRLVDRVMEIVAASDVGDIVVDASGDVAMRGASQRIGLEHPFDARRVIGVWEVTDAALCASATNRRAWGDGLHHVLDARTGLPVRTIAATWAVADTAMRADALATALFFDGGPRLAHEWGIEWVRMTTDGVVEWSPGCRADLFVRTGSVEQ
ncbi:FAD:protein FMN transferase [Microbacterium pumilum]|uniref:FAD:protein FMN transferase n=1 Tax=Microbacterium pumilum TaxID=344165 RepID=A0ABP5E8J5_9MICO